METTYSKVQKLRKENFPIKAISSELGISPNTVKSFLHPDQFSKRALSYINTFEKRRKGLMGKDRLPKESLTREKCRLYAALLYWCEGSKYPASNVMNFTSSDVNMLKLFLYFLRRGFDLKENKFRVWLQIHTDHIYQDIISFWSKELGISQEQFLKPRVTVKRGGRYRQIYHGTCSVKYGDYTLILRMMGMSKRFFKATMGGVI